jgi:hypothetical protein
MMKRAHSTLALALPLVLAVSVDAFAAGALRGKTYSGKTATSGVNSEGQQARLTAGGISLKVSSSGRSVTVRFASPYPLLYCRSSEKLHSQSTKAASISGSGRFRATIGERFVSGPGSAPIVQVVTGRFSGRTVKGTIRTQAAECSGSTTFSATAR